MSERAPLLSLRDITKTYRMGDVPFPVLHGITFTVERGEFVSILGPSGSGKSTLMNIIGCLDVPDGGTYTLGSRAVAGLSEGEMARLRNREIGFVFQNFQLLPRLSTLDNVMLPLIYAKVPRAARLARARAELARVGLADKEGNLPRQLSGGQQQRVAIARALVTRPRLLLADEPTGALDRATGAQIMDIFRSLNEEGITVVMITHDQKVASYASRTVHILDGRLFSAEEYAALMDS
ncbi:MAG: ABC transporter ATP-binding protein [Clostridia bacterium]|nr:ABC transporter ATP-binding protein [Clostridia bacterium]